jgi:RNA polymerase sigma-70 factor (ECF subfamily)
VRDDITWAVKAAREGDPDAWDVILRRHQRPLHVFAAELVRDPSASLEIVQETFIAATKHIGGLRDDRKFTSWIFTIARQKCTQHLRLRRDRERPLEEIDETAFGHDTDPGDLLIRDEDEAAFLAAVDRLPLPQREAIVLRFLEEFSLEEIAAIVSTPLGTVKSRLHHARQTLKQWMQNEDSPRNPVATTR